MVNNVTSVAFKINKLLLDYLNNEGVIQNLLMDPYAIHKFEELDKRTKYQQSVYTSHNSKLVLQETILGLAEFYSRFSEIYFPVRLNHRGRMYCSSSYLNYQSSVLAKALLLFAEPGIIKKNNLDSIVYLKA